MFDVKVVVVGAGTMGSGIAYVSAASGHDVVVVEQDQKLLDSGMKRVEDYIQRAISRGHITKDQASTINTKLHGTLDFNTACTNASLVVEAVFEDPIVKEKVFATIDKYSPTTDDEAGRANQRKPNVRVDSPDWESFCRVTWEDGCTIT